MDVNMDPAVTDPDMAVDSSPGLNVTPVPGGKPIPLSPFLFITASYHGTQAIPLLFLSHLTTVFLLIKCSHPITWCHKTLGGHVDASGSLDREDPGYPVGVFCLPVSHGIRDPVDALDSSNCEDLLSS